MLTLVQKVALLLAFELDDSYTPTHLAIRAGTGAGDTHDVRNMQFEKPNGWIEIDMSTEPTEDLEGP
jgi:anaphase-promoting complex subunit 10